MAGCTLKYMCEAIPACITALLGEAPFAGCIPCAPIISVAYFKAVVGAIIDIISL